jgi:valyl-tRNA synthetase
MPFITEALWLRLPWPANAEREASLVVAKWPEGRAEHRDETAEARMEALMELIGSVRTLRSEYNIPPSAEVTLQLGSVPDALRDALQIEERALRRMARVGQIAEDGVGESRAGAHAVLKSGAEVFVPLAGIIDLDRERDRLGKERDRLSGQLRGTESKLANEQFTGKAPVQVVEFEREKAASLRDQLERLTRKLEALS